MNRLKQLWASSVAARPHATSRQEQGLILILVVVVLVLMVLLGTTYLQVARVHRLGVTSYNGDIDAVVESVLATIEQTLRDDLMDDDGKFFNQGTLLASGVQTGYDEIYDYPWVNDAVTSRPYTKLLGLGPPPHSGDAIGGEYDDPWLASAVPDFDRSGNGTPNENAADRVWPQITNLTGYFVSASGLADLTGGAIQEDGVASIASNNLDSQTDWQLDEGFGASAKLVDTDLDGLGDARWEFAPLSQVNGVIYVMAVRIVDLASMVNADVALTQTDNTGAYSAFADAPSWRNPAELDLATFFDRFDTTNGFPAAHTLTDWRFNSAVGMPVPLGDREVFWDEAASRWGSLASGTGAYLTSGAAYNYQGLDMDDEWALRRNGGLSDGTQQGNLEGQLTTFLRTATDDTASITNATDAYNHFENSTINPRPYLTVSSGSAIFAPRVTGDADRPLKLDVNVASVASLSQRIQSVYNVNTPAALPGGLANTITLGDQLAANVADYTDEDNRLTNQGSRWGWEALPAITEVAVQRYYQITAAADNDVDSDGDGDETFENPEVDTGPIDTWQVTWTQQGDTGYAIEIANPYRQPISLEDVHLYINNVRVGSGDLDSFAGAGVNAYNTTNHAASLDGNNDRYLFPDDVLILRRNATGGTDDDWSVLAAGSPIVVDVTDNWPTTPDDSTTAAVSVELRASDSGGSALSWPYVQLDAESIPDVIDVPEFDHNSVANSGTDPTGAADYRQRMYRGNGDGLNMLTVTATDFVNGKIELEPTLDTFNDIYKLGETAKAGKADLSPLTTQQLVFRDDAMVHVGELALVAAVGPSPSQTFADVWSNQTDADFFRIDPFTTASLVTDYNVNHATLLLDRLTTMSPHVDALDNNHDGDIDEDAETFVPGTINLNTAALPVLDHALPITDAALRTRVVNEIVAFRENTDNRNGGAPGAGKPGIAFGAELLDRLKGTIDSVAGPGNDSSDTDQLGSVQVDFLSNPASAIASADGIIDDREEQTLIGRWLMQVASGRSDTFVAYIYVKGFPADQFGTGTSSLESARVIAVFNRSQVTQQGDPVLVGTLRLQ